MPPASGSSSNTLDRQRSAANVLVDDQLIPAAALLQDEIIDALISAAKRDFSVTIISQDGAIANQFADVEGIEVVDSTLEESQKTSGRLLVDDDDTVLLSVFNDSDQLDISQETVI